MIEHMLVSPLHHARRRVASWSAWVAVVAVAGLSLALRRRLAEAAHAEESEQPG